MTLFCRRPPPLTIPGRVTTSLPTRSLPAHIAAASVAATQAAASKSAFAFAIAVEIFVWIVFIAAMVGAPIEGSDLPHEAAHTTTMHGPLVIGTWVVWCF